MLFDTSFTTISLNMFTSLVSMDQVIGMENYCTRYHQEKGEGNGISIAGICVYTVGHKQFASDRHGIIA